MVVGGEALGARQSVTEKVVRHSGDPVLVMRGGATA